VENRSSPEEQFDLVSQMRNLTDLHHFNFQISSFDYDHRVGDATTFNAPAHQNEKLPKTKNNRWSR
jgi:hypothetical protein